MLITKGRTGRFNMFSLDLSIQCTGILIIFYFKIKMQLPRLGNTSQIVNHLEILHSALVKFEMFLKVQISDSEDDGEITRLDIYIDNTMTRSLHSSKGIGLILVQRLSCN